MNAKVLGLGLTTTVVAIAGLGLCLPNILWLKHSTVKISNLGASVVPQTRLQVGDKTLDYSSIDPGEAEFALLPQASQGSLAVTLPPSLHLESFCHTYVDAKMYHVDITVKDGKVLGCRTSLPILSSLWVFKAFL